MIGGSRHQAAAMQNSVCRRILGRTVARDMHFDTNRPSRLFSTALDRLVGIICRTTIGLREVIPILAIVNANDIRRTSPSWMYVCRRLLSKIVELHPGLSCWGGIELLSLVRVMNLAIMAFRSGHLCITFHSKTCRRLFEVS